MGAVSKNRKGEPNADRIAAAENREYRADLRRLPAGEKGICALQARRSLHPAPREDPGRAPIF